MKCNRDCFNCPYPDCIVDDITDEERDNLDQIDREILKTVTDKTLSEKARRHEYYLAHKDLILQRSKEWREKNPEKRRKQAREWYRKNKNTDKQKKKQLSRKKYYKQYYRLHRDEILEKRKKHYENVILLRGGNALIGNCGSE